MSDICRCGTPRLCLATGTAPCCKDVVAARLQAIAVVGRIPPRCTGEAIILRRRARDAALAKQKRLACVFMLAVAVRRYFHGNPVRQLAGEHAEQSTLR